MAMAAAHPRSVPAAWSDQLPTSKSQLPRQSTVEHLAREWHSVIAKAGMVMRGAKPVQRIPEAKHLGASMGFAEPHGHGGRASQIRAGRVVGSTPNVQLLTPKAIEARQLTSAEIAHRRQMLGISSGRAQTGEAPSSDPRNRQPG